MAVNERDAILKGKHPIDRDAILSGTAHLDKNKWLILQGQEGKDSGRDFILNGLTGINRDFILDTKPDIRRSCILSAEDPPDINAHYNFIEAEMSDFQLTSGRLINEITLKYAYDNAEGQFKASITKHNPLSKLLYGTAQDSREMKMIQGTRQAEKIADAILKTSSSPEIKASFGHDLRSFHVEVGDIVSITHLAGLGDNGYQKALALVSLSRIQGIKKIYEALMKPDLRLYMSELVTLTQTAGAGQAGISITYEAGVATISVYADVQGNPKVEGAEITINGVKKITDTNGQVRFNILPGRYTAYIRASGYEDAEINFSV